MTGVVTRFGGGATITVPYNSTDLEAVAAAEQVVKEALADGMTALDQDGNKVKAFDPETQSEVNLLPRLRGGF